MSLDARRWAVTAAPARLLLTRLLMAVGALPLLAGRPAPLQDWPNHVARMHILTGLLQGNPFWGHYYRLVGFLLPGAALDLSILGLAHLGLPIEAAAQLFLLATYAAFLGGFYALSRALGSFDPSKIPLAILLFYSNALFWGLANYLLGIGLMLALLALWLTMRRNPRQPIRTARLLVAALGAALLLFTHVIAAVAWIAALGCFDLERLLADRSPLRRRLADSASWLVALVVVAGLLHGLPGATGHDFSMRYAGTGPGGIAGHKLKLFGKLLLGGSLLQDAASLAALLVCGLAVAASRPRLQAAPALTVLAMLVLALAAPERLGTGSVLDVRLAILPLLLLAASVRIEPWEPAVWAIGAAVLLRTLVLAWQWHMAGLVFRDFRQQTASLPPGSIMMVAYGTPLPSLTWQQVWSPPITALATQVVFRDVFMPAIFANPAQQPLALREPFQDLTQPWNMTDAGHLAASATQLGAICASGRFRGVYLTALYPGRFLPAHAGTALLHAQPEFLILDACRLPGGPAGGPP